MANRVFTVINSNGEPIGKFSGATPNKAAMAAFAKLVRDKKLPESQPVKLFDDEPQLGHQTNKQIEPILAQIDDEHLVIEV